MAYLRKLDGTCTRCHDDAVVQLRNCRDEPVGMYCERHMYDAERELRSNEAMNRRGEVRLWFPDRIVLAGEGDGS